jgi:hypothetical protein
MTTGNKFSKDKFFTQFSHTATSGVVGQTEYEVWGEVKLRVVTTFTSSGTLTIQGRIHHSDSWEAIGTVASGGASESFDIDSFDYIRFNFTVAAGSTGEVAASGFFKASSSGGAGGASFTTIQTDAGTNPVAVGATDTLTLTSADSSITITGTSGTDTVDLAAAPADDTGAIQFNDAGSLGGDDTELFWDNTNKRLGIHHNTPDYDLQIGDGGTSGNRYISLERTVNNYLRLLVLSGDHRLESSQALQITSTGSIRFRPNSSTSLYIVSTGCSLFNGASLPANNRLYIKGSSTGGNNVLHCVDSASASMMIVRDDGTVNMPALPTSAAGLATGDLWNNSGVINIA